MDGKHEHILINYLDRALEENEMRAIEELMNTDTETRMQYQYLQLAVRAVEYAALYDQVAAVRKDFKTIRPAQVIQGYLGRKGPRWRTLYRAAACLFLFAAGIAAIKFTTTTGTRIYDKAFMPYTLHISRGINGGNEIEKLYRNQNWTQVISVYNTIAEKDNKTLFLAGVAYLQLKQYVLANQRFEQVLLRNAKAGDDYFEEEAQYYLALGYLANNRVSAAVTILQTIRANKNHLYFEQANAISSTSLHILSYKYGK